jgi:hypothetical protein
MFRLSESTNELLFRATPFARLDYLAILRGEEAPKGVMPFGWASGASIPSDIVWTDALFPILISRQVRSSLAEITGWTSHPVSLLDPNGRGFADYHLLTVLGRCGPIDFTQSILEQKKYPRGTFPEYRGLFFDQDSWDRSDIFMPVNRIGFIFITDAARDALASLKDANCCFEPLAEVQLDEMTKELVERATPG